MSHKLSIIIPVGVSRDVSAETENYLVGYFGGFSSWMITGGYWDGKNTRIEDSNLYFAITGQPLELVQECGKWLEEFIKSNSSEQSVLWWIEEIIK